MGDVSVSDVESRGTNGVVVVGQSFVGGDIEIEENNVGFDISRAGTETSIFVGFSSIGGDVSIEDNVAERNISVRLNHSIAGDVEITGNSSETRVRVEGSLINGDLSCSDNNNLEVFDNVVAGDFECGPNDDNDDDDDDDDD